MLDFRYPQKTFYKVRAMETGYELAIKIHKMTLALPKFEMYEEVSQIRRAAKSIPSNIVEGYCLRKYKI
jgi:four helix bundle protein